MANDVKPELTELRKHDNEVRRPLLAALAHEISEFVDLMERAYEIYPLRLRQ